MSTARGGSTHALREGLRDAGASRQIYKVTPQRDGGAKPQLMPPPHSSFARRSDPPAPTQPAPIAAVRQRRHHEDASLRHCL